MATFEQWKRQAELFAGFRAQSAPEPDDPRAASETCKQCGDVFWRWKGRVRRYCPTCAGNRQVESVISMSDKSGPVYEKYVRRQLEHLNAEAERLGL